MAKQTAKAKPAASSPIARLLETAPKPAPAAKEISEADVLAFLELQEKGSEILKRARNAIWRKIAEQQVDPEVRQVLAEIVRLKSFDVLRIAYLDCRREHAPVKRKSKQAEKEHVA